MKTEVINNIPGVRGAFRSDLTSIGMDAKIYGKVAALIASDKVYLLLLGTSESNQAAKDPIFDQVIGTFRPE